MDLSDIGNDIDHVLLTEEQIGARLDEMAAQIDKDYAGKDLLLVGVLKGAVMVMADLSRRLHTAATMDWMAVSSYGSGTKSSGVVRILKDLDTDLTDRHVLIVEDIVDSGLTLSWLLSNLRSRGPASVEIAAAMSEVLDARIEYAPTSIEAFRIKMETLYKFPPFLTQHLVEVAQNYRDGIFSGTNDVVEKVTGQPPLSVQQFVAKYRAAFV